MNEKTVLSQELLEQIIFGMENQADEFFLDIEKLTLVKKNQKESEDHEELRYLTLPRWTPADGYNTMERFVLSLNNPLYRETLKSILHTGKGVFRNFKNFLKDKPEIEKLWFHFKSRELRSHIQAWLDSFENYRNMMSLGEAQENLEELILSDFLFLVNPEQHLHEVQRLERILLDDLEESAPPSLLTERTYYTPLGDNSFLVAESPQNELAGFIAFKICEETAHITSLFTVLEYRGLKVAEELYIKGVEYFRKQGVNEIIIESIQVQGIMPHFLEEKGFTPRLISYSKKLSKGE